MARPDSSAPIVALRSALAGTDDALRDAAIAKVKSALHGKTHSAAARQLEISRGSLYRILRDFERFFK